MFLGATLISVTCLIIPKLVRKSNSYCSDIDAGDTISLPAPPFPATLAQAARIRNPGGSRYVPLFAARTFGSTSRDAIKSTSEMGRVIAALTAKPSGAARPAMM